MRVVIFHLLQPNAVVENRFGHVVKQQSRNPPLMVFSEFTSGASLFKRGRCNERRNEKQLRLLSRDRTQRLSTLNATDGHAARLYEKVGSVAEIKQVVKRSALCA